MTSRSVTGAGSAVIAGLALSEITFGLPLSLASAFLGGAVGLVDRISDGLAARLLGPLAALLLIGRVLAGHNCLGLGTPSESELIALLLASAGFGWLLAVVIAATIGRAGYLQAGFGSLVLLFALAELVVFVASPAGLPVIFALPAQVSGTALVLVIGFGAFGGWNPRGAIELIGWTLAVAQGFIFVYLLTQPWDACSSDLLRRAVLAATSAVVAAVLGRFR